MIGVLKSYTVALHDSPVTAEVEAHLPHPSAAERDLLVQKIKRLLVEKDAVLVAYYFVHEDLQRLAEETGGYVSDSLDMARFGHEHKASTLVVAGVRFIGETAKILNPEKRVLMPTLEAESSLDLDCPADKFIPFCDANPDRVVVVYSDTSALAVKARADWVVTSSIAVKVVEHLHAQGKKILWAPDKHLGSYIQRETGADMLIWEGRYVVHEEFKATAIREYREKYPDAGILVHPESPPDVIAMADAVGFLSENHHFAEACVTSGLTFIGPTPENIRLGGDKAKASQIMKRKGIPVVPGSDGPVTTEEIAMKASKKIGFPVIIKASAGGGGHGMRIVKEEKDLEQALYVAQREALTAFGNSELYIEKYIPDSRHIEVQIIADNKGNIIHLKSYNSETSRYEETGETVAVYNLARSLTLETFTSLLVDYPDELRRSGVGARGADRHGHVAPLPRAEQLRQLLAREPQPGGAGLRRVK